MDELVDQLADLFMETGKAHHQAFIETDGVDPEWAIWYADYLKDRLSELLGASFSKSELIYLIIKMDLEQRSEAPGANWRRYYANYLVEYYL